jgi:two-component system, NarL family, sensor kinase
VDKLIALIGAAVPVAVGTLVLARSDQRRIGGLLVAHGLCIGLFLGLASERGASRAEMVADQLMAGTWTLLFLWLVLIAYLLPDGHAASPRQRTWIRLGLVGNVVFWVGAAGDPNLFEPDPLPVPWLPVGVSTAVGVVGLIWVVVFFFGSVVSVLRRLRETTGDDRLRLLWFLFGALSVPVALLLNWASYFLLDDPSPLAPFAGALVMCALPVAIGIAIVRTNLFDIELVLSRTLTYGVLTALVFGAYAGLLALTGSIVGNRSVGGIAAVAVVAVAAAPTQRWLRGRIERWVYGYRSEPHRAIRMMSERVDAADPLDLLPAITSTVTEALSVQRAWVEHDGPTTPATNVVRAPLVHQGTPMGSLAVEIPAGRSFSPDDTRLLHDLARQTAVLVRAGQLNADLVASRSRFVSAREEERKRLRRDLHDGLGPSLAAVVLKLNAAGTRSDATERTALLAEIRDEVKDAIAEIRRVVDDLRPPAIDEVGLLGALRQRAAALSTETLQYLVTGPDLLPPVPAAVEVAAFRIASEAMTTVAKHSGASRCTIDIGIGGTLEVTVTDNGRGSSRSIGHGVGWTSMTDRASELGGSCTISSRAEGGLVVRAVLPLGEHVDVEANP